MRVLRALKRVFPALVCVALALACLAGCGLQGETVVTQPYEGTWYFAKNAVECHIGEGKIYEDDLKSKEGQSLRGVYSEMDGYIEANLAGVGGVQIPRALYVVQTDAGEALCDSADGTVYFYRDALAALEALEAAETEAVSAPSGEVSSSTPETLEPTAEVASSDEPSVRSMPGADEDGSSEAQPTQEVKASGNMVWIPQSGSKYHSTSSCSGMKNPSQITRAEAESRGYTPCKRCY